MNTLAKKLAYFGIGGFVCAFFNNLLMLQEPVLTYRSLLYGFVGLIAVLIGSLFSEYFISEKFSSSNIWCALLGCVLAIGSSAAGIALHYASL